jgi:cardiolipin synthase A/B
VTTAPQRIRAADEGAGETANPHRRWDEELVFTSGDEFYDSLEAGIRDARESIDFEMYIFASDEVGERFAAVLLEAVARGVAVRVIVDGAGSPGWRRTFGPRFAAAGLPFLVYHELPWERVGFQRQPGRSRLTLIQLLGAINRRDHRKVAVVDGSRAWVGSRNLHRCHSESLSGDEAWRDTSVMVAGAAVTELTRAFDRVWELHRGRRGKRLRIRASRDLVAASDLVRLNSTHRLRRRHYRKLIDSIRRASRRIWVTTAYFVPRRPIVQALEVASRRGIDVRILLPGQSDLFFMPWFAVAFYPQLLRAGVRIFEYQPAILHAKSMIVDDVFLVGTANLNHRSLIHDLEVDLVVTGPGAREALERQLARDLEQSQEVTPDQGLHTSATARLAARGLLGLRHWF